MGSTAASKHAKAQINKLDIARNNTTKLILDQIERNTRDTIEAFFAWDAAHPVGEQPPINRVTERSPAALRKYAVEMIKKAARLKLGPKENGWWSYVHAASSSLASAWWTEYNAAAAQREQAEREAAQREREREEHEAALKPNSKRIAELQAIIRDAAKGEQFLAELQRALVAHEKARDARKELQELKVKAENAATALGKKSPVIDVPKPAHIAAAESMANIMHSALRRN